MVWEDEETYPLSHNALRPNHPLENLFEQAKGGSKQNLGNYWSRKKSYVGYRREQERVTTVLIVKELWNNGQLVDKTVIPYGAYKSNAKLFKALGVAKREFAPRRAPNGVEVLKIYTVDYEVDSDTEPKVMLMWEEKAR